MKRVSEGFPAGKPFCYPEVVTNSSEKVIISYLVRETIKKRESMASEIFVQMTAALRYDIELTYVKRTNVKGKLLWAARLQEKSIL